MSDIAPLTSFRGPARRAVLAVALALMITPPAHAGEVNDLTGLAIKGYDPVAYFRDARPVTGSAQFTATHKGATFRFATAANRDAFMAEPQRYAPQYGGFCAYAAAQGYKADIDPAAYAVVDGKLYLNYNKSIQSTWNKDPAGYIAKGDANWPKVAPLTDVTR
ncbi:YHS domain-containing (seleno)protein [Bosea sp. (in: a-proteobacteria)]|jgi:YHS domain-containing protein|uniref:YHS domain-containing (seleno)protein n=1 Tax=Bosea sp. (in: a-proteobacteria) TaxID=1871050 RepID=UPI003F709C68